MPTLGIVHPQWWLATLFHHSRYHYGPTRQCHQDCNTNTPETLSLPARLNISADAETHKAYSDYPTFCQVPFLPSKHVALVPNSLPITSNQLSSASFAYYTSTMLAYFKQKRQWSDVTFLSIDWLVSDKEYQQLSTEHHLLSFKLQNVLWSTHHVHHLYKSAQSHSCTSCCLIPEAHNRVSVAGGGAIYPPWCTVYHLIPSNTPNGPRHLFGPYRCIPMANVLTTELLSMGPPF